MLEDILKKQEAASKILRELEAAKNEGDIEKCKELSDKAYVAMLEQSLAIAEEINHFKEISEKYNFSEEGRYRIEAVKQSLNASYSVCSRSLRRILYFQEKYNFTNAPKE